MPEASAPSPICTTARSIGPRDSSSRAIVPAPSAICGRSPSTTSSRSSLAAAYASAAWPGYSDIWTRAPVHASPRPWRLRRRPRRTLRRRRLAPSGVGKPLPEVPGGRAEPTRLTGSNLSASSHVPRPLKLPMGVTVSSFDHDFAAKRTGERVADELRRVQKRLVDPIRGCSDPSGERPG